MSADNDWLPSIPDGNYQLRFDYYETAIHFGKACKVILHFTVLDFGKYFETKLSRYYTVERLIGKHGKNGRFKIKGQTSSPRPRRRLAAFAGSPAFKSKRKT